MYEQARHEPFIDTAWDEAQARHAIDRIVRDAHGRLDPQKLWPVHPLDQLGPEQTEPLKMLYFGAAGVIWALGYLNRVGATDLTGDYSSALADLPANNRMQLRLSQPHNFSYLMGDAGSCLYIGALLRPRIYPTRFSKSSKPMWITPPGS